MFKSQGYQFQRIHFVPAKNPDAHSIDPLKLGLIPLNDPIETAQHTMKSNNKHPVAGKENKRRELFREEDLSMNWTKIRGVGSGLCNLGNTCFMNSVLQCLLHTPPLAELLLSNKSLSYGPSTNGFDPIAMTRQLLQESLGGRRDYISPHQHARTLKRVSRSFKIGRQEDAHEYLIALLDAMHERSIAGINPKPPPDVEFTSFIYRIFGGRIRSQVKCTQCGYESNTYDPFVDLSLEINHAKSVKHALERFTAGETLDGANKYKCPRQKTAVKAVKRITIEQAPNILIVQLKRFEFSFSGRKISKPVAFDDVLDLSPFMSKKPSTPIVYDLYGVLVHQGHSMHSGHYYCFVKSIGEWHKFDDTRVNTTSARNVLGQLPYILFYVRRTAESSNSTMMNGGVPRPLQPAHMNGIVVHNSKNSNNEVKSSLQKKARINTTSDINTTTTAMKRKRAVHHTDDDDDNDDNDQEQIPPSVVVSKANKKQKRSVSSIQDTTTINTTTMDDDDDDDLGKTSIRRGLRSRPALSLATPISFGRRAKRLAEQMVLLNTMATTKGNSPAAQNKRRKTVVTLDKQRSAKRRLNVLHSIAEEKNDGDEDMDDAVDAPEWPPIKPQQKKEGIRNRKSNGGLDVKEFLKKGGMNGVGLGVDAWEDTDKKVKRTHDKLLRASAPSRRKIDEYDAEYDKGKMKKVRNKNKESDKIDSSVFDAAYSVVKKGGGGVLKKKGGGGGKRGGGMAGRKKQRAR